MAPGSRSPARASDIGPEGRPPSALDALIVFAVLLVLLALSYWLYGKDAASGPNQIALIFAGLVAGGIAHKNGMSWEGVRQAVVGGVSSGLTAIFILLAIGALIGTWALGGTIVATIYYGLDLLRRLCGRRPRDPDPRLRPVRLLLPSEPADDDRHRRPRRANAEKLSGRAIAPVLAERKPPMTGRSQARVDRGAILMMMRKARSGRTRRTAP